MTKHTIFIMLIVFTVCSSLQSGGLQMSSSKSVDLSQGDSHPVKNTVEHSNQAKNTESHAVSESGQASEASARAETITDADADFSENAMNLIDLAGEEEIDAPETNPPSKFMIWLRSVGLAVVYKCIALKKWFGKKLFGSSENSVAHVTPEVNGTVVNKAKAVAHVMPEVQAPSVNQENTVDQAIDDKKEEVHEADERSS